MRRIIAGIVAGAAGTVALNAATYIDMAIRGRPASSVPASLVDELSRKMNVSLGGDPQENREVRNRESGLGALLGYGTGIVTGALYGLSRPNPSGSAVKPGIALGLAAMAASDAPAVSLGVTDPRRWGLRGWLSDILPHIAFGLVTASVYRRLIAVRDSHPSPW